MRRCFSRLLVIALFSATTLAQDMNFERSKARDILAIVAHDVQQNFYDPTLKGLDWAGLTQQARAKIDKAETVGDCYTAIFWLVDQLHDSHTKFFPPPYQFYPFYGFRAKPFGDDVRIYQFDKDSFNRPSPAEEAGLRLGDKLVALNTYQVGREDYDLASYLFRVLRPLQSVDFTVQHQNDPPRVIRVTGRNELTRLGFSEQARAFQTYRVPFRHHMSEDQIGYVYVADFIAPVPFLHELMGKISGARGVVLDLRGNPGGGTDRASAFAGFFQTSDETWATVVGRQKKTELKVEPQHPNFTGPMVVLVDSESSSGAEALARYWQKKKRATIIGDQTMGRLTASSFFPGGLAGQVAFATQIAVARFVLPGGEEVEHKGVTPDQLCIPGWDDIAAHRDPCRAQAFAVIRNALGLPDKGGEDSDAADKSMEPNYRDRRF